MSDLSDAHGPLNGESAKAFAAYVAYRSLPARRRSIRAAFEHQTGRTGIQNAPGRWLQWSSAHAWVSRARQWDRDQERHRQANQAEARREDLKLADKVANALLAPALLVLRDLARDGNHGKITPRTAAELIRTAWELKESAWTGAQDLDERTAEELLPQDGLDVLDSLKLHRDMAPLLVHIHELGADLEPADADDDADQDVELTA